MDFSSENRIQPVLIDTPRLLLKGFSPEDMDAVFTRLSKAEIMELLGHQTETDYEKEADKQRQGYASYNRRFLLFLLIDKASGTVIGRCGLHNWNPDHRRAEIGYVMTVETFKQQGIMSEALSGILDYGFSVLELNRIEAIVAPENVPSLRLLEKNGFVLEGRLRKHYPTSDGFEDSLIFGLLREEYKSDLYEG